MSEILALQTFTTTYSESQDRIKLTGKNEQNTYITIWSSRRLLLRLLPPVIGWAEQSTTVNQPLSSEGIALAQDFAQQNAKNQLEKQESVEAPEKAQVSDGASHRSWLVYEIDIKKSDQILQLVFKNDQKRSSFVQLNNIQTRQWLSIIYSQWIKAEWEDFGWPLWIKAPSEMPDGEIH